MPIVNTVEDAKRLKAKLQTDHKRLIEWRKVRDRRMDDVLATLKDALSDTFKAAFIPYQTAEPEHELMKRKHILVSNPVEIEVISKSGDAKVVKLAQSLEEADEALLEALFPMATQLQECDALLGDDRLIIALDKLPPPPTTADYADRDGMQAYAESDEPDDDEDTPRMKYRNAYRDKGDHDKAYAQVFDEAQMNGRLPWRVRIVDGATFDAFEDEDGVAIGMEHGYVPLAPVLQALSEYGMKQEGDSIVLTRNDQATEHPAIGWPVSPDIAEEQDETTNLDTVEYTQIRTRDECVILIEHPKLEGPDGKGCALIKYPNALTPKSTGYYIAYPVEKLRGNRDDRSVPAILGLLVEAQLENVIVSSWSAMALEEATREPYLANSAQPGVPPLDRTQRPTAQPARDGRAPAVQGEILRAQTTGIKMAELREWVDKQTERYRSNEFFSGSGSSSETGIHLARMQTAYLTEMMPFQTKRAEIRKSILNDIHHATATQRLKLFVPWAPSDPRPKDGDIRVAEPREITPEMASLPVDIRVTIGAESPETKYAREQASRAEVDFGTRSPLTHMETTGVKDPAFELKRIAIGSLLRDAITGADGQPGWAVTAFRQAIESRVQEWVDAKYPPPPQPPVDPMMQQAGPGMVPPGVAQFPSPVQTDPMTGAPVAPGAVPMPA